MRDAGSKNNCIVFPEGKSLVGGWVLLAKKLCILRVEPKVCRPGGGASLVGRRVKTLR